jgi:bifunctional non-homologous end joining protein LigD
VKVPVPALATLSHERFFHPDWIYERKLDGERCLATKQGDLVRLHSRSGRDVTHSFPEVVEALEQQATPDFVIDGEVVAFEDGRTSFAALQPRIHLRSADKARATKIKVYYYVFDVLEIDGHDTRGVPLLDRKGLLYPSGRSRDWLKFKCESGQEFVIGGFTDPQGARSGFGALLLGYYRDDDFVYAGKVGTGFDTATLRSMHESLRALETDTTAFTVGQLPKVGVHWVRPKLVCEVAFTEWTRAGQLRHPRFLGLRRDKSAADVVRE